MGSCECYGEQVQNELHTKEIKLQILPVRVDTHKEASQENSQQVSNGPNKDCVQELEQFPQLPNIIKEVDHQMGEFSHNLQGLEESDRGEPILKAYKLRSKIVYQGQWKSGKIHGLGRFLLPDGSYLRSRTNQNFGEGTCRMIRPNGDFYEGQIKYFKANGHGKYRQGNIIYEGDFYNNQPHGLGKQIGQDYMFKGLYEYGMKIDGTLTWNLKLNSPHTYIGTFYENSFNGIGTLITSKGKYEGQFMRGLKSGYGTFTWKNKAKFEGTYYNDKKNGQGRMYNPRGQLVLAGKWVDDCAPQTQSQFF